MNGLLGLRSKRVPQQSRRIPRQSHGVDAAVKAERRRFATSDRFSSVRILFFLGLVDGRGPFVRFLHFRATTPLSLSEVTCRRPSDAIAALEGGLCD